MPKLTAEFEAQQISYEEMQAHIARGRAMQAEYVAATVRKLGRMIVGRGRTGASAKAHRVNGHPA